MSSSLFCKKVIQQWSTTTPVVRSNITSKWVMSSKSTSRLLLTRRSLSSSSRILSEAKVQPSRFRNAIRKTFLGTGIAALLGVSFISYSIYREARPRKQAPQSPTFPNGSKRKTLIILGSGWGSISLLKSLDTTLYNVIVVSPRNHFLFTPLLPSTPVGTVEMKSIIEPVRNIARRCPGEVHYYEAEVTDIKPEDKKITIKSTSKHYDDSPIDLDYDYLVIGVGAQSNTFGTPGVWENASFLKEINDAQDIRQKIMDSIENAISLPVGSPERKRLLSYVIVGGGPTGVEFAAELKDYIDEDLNKWVPNISKEITVTLLEAQPNILNMFDKSLVNYAQDLFAKEKIDLRLKSLVKKVDKTIVTYKTGDEINELPYGVLVWATGNGQRDVTKNLMEKIEKQDSRRGLLINEKLQLLGHEDSVFAIGDCTFHAGLFPTAEVAHQEGEYLADTFKRIYKVDQAKWEASQNPDKENLKAKITKLESSIDDFKYVHRGALAYLGREKAIADLSIGGSKYTSSGSFTFLFWRFAYLSMCISFRNRYLIAMDWVKMNILGRNSSV